jgi:hypothetical protein
MTDNVYVFLYFTNYGT